MNSRLNKPGLNKFIPVDPITIKEPLNKDLIVNLPKKKLRAQGRPMGRLLDFGQLRNISVSKHISDRSKPAATGETAL